MRLRSFTVPASVLVGFLAASETAAAQFTISELYINSPGDDNTEESLEIRGPASTSLAGWFFLAIEGDGANAGVVDQSVDLSLFSTGANGLCLIRAGANVILPGPCADTLVFEQNFTPDIENGTNSFVLGSGTAPAVGTDLDLGNDGLDGGAIPGFTVADAVAVTDGDAGDRQYAAELGGENIFGLSHTPDLLYRIYNASGPCNWNGGDVLGTNPSGPYDFDLTENFGFAAHGMCGLPQVDLGCLNVLPDDDGDEIANACDDPIVGSAFCFGDGSGTACPCSNPGNASNGCANGSFAVGTLLRATGSASVSGDTLVLRSSCSTPNELGIYFQGNDALNGGLGLPFGDGLQCVGTNLTVIQRQTANGNGATSTTLSVSAAGGVAPGDVKHYQFWYRDPLLSPCTANLSVGLNLSNGLTIAWGL